MYYAGTALWGASGELCLMKTPEYPPVFTVITAPRVIKDSIMVGPESC